MRRIIKLQTKKLSLERKETIFTLFALLQPIHILAVLLYTEIVCTVHDMFIMKIWKIFTWVPCASLWLLTARSCFKPFHNGGRSSVDRVKQNPQIHPFFGKIF